MNIVDIFPYFNEKELLELRINLLYDYVDRFIICDANRTHSGLNKEFTANDVINELNLPRDKINVIEVDLSIYDNNENQNWVRERAQRNAAAKYILENDVCIVSDCDEIINPEYIKYYTNIAIENPINILRIPMVNLSGRADLEVCNSTGQSHLWSSAFICLYHHAYKYTLSEIRESYSMKNSNFMYKNVEFSDIFITENGAIKSAGWHFSWMGNNKRNIIKYQSFVHRDDCIENAIYTYSNQSVEEFIKNYTPSVGATDSLGRQNFILKSYSQDKLPNKLYQLHRVKNFLLPDRKKILFHENQLSERGTTVATHDYAYFCRKLLDVEPIITFNNQLDNNQQIIKNFQKEFTVIPYNNFIEVEHIVDQYKIDYFYAIKYGTQDNIIVPNTKNLIHSVFNYNIEEKHGDIYAVISEWLTQKSNNQFPFIPHMLNLPNHDYDFREILRIPANDIVIGRYGAKETFNIDFVNDSILKILEKRKNIWFLFVNTEKKIFHDRCLYFNSIIDLNDKVKFINTCDAMLHARDYGETFGLSVLEFASKNKQIISYDNEELQNTHPLGGRNHFLFLKNNCFKYQNKESLENILLNIGKINPFNTYYLNQQFSPESVIKKFNEIYLV